MRGACDSRCAPDVRRRRVHRCRVRAPVAAQVAKPAQAATSDHPAPKRRRRRPHARPSTLSGCLHGRAGEARQEFVRRNLPLCHTPTSHTGATFTAWWRGKPLSDLFAFISENMPQERSGKPRTRRRRRRRRVSAEDERDAGRQERAVSRRRLVKKFRIDVNAPRGTSTATRKKP